MAADAELVGGLGVQAEVHTHNFLFLGDPEAHELVDGEGDDEGHTEVKTMDRAAANSWATSWVVPPP